MGWLRWDGVKDEKLWGLLKNPIFRGGFTKNQYRTRGNCLKASGFEIYTLTKLLKRREIFVILIIFINFCVCFYSNIFEVTRLKLEFHIYIYMYICIYIYIYIYTTYICIYIYILHTIYSSVG